MTTKLIRIYSDDYQNIDRRRWQLAGQDGASRTIADSIHYLLGSTSIQLGEATERQIAALNRLGFGNTTAIIRTAIDRMHQQERGAYRMTTGKMFDTRTVNRDEIAEYIVESVIVHASSEEYLASYGGDVDATADGIANAWTELYPNELPVDQDGDPLDIRRYAVGYFDRLAESADD